MAVAVQTWQDRWDAEAELTRRSILSALKELPASEKRNDHIKAMRRMRKFPVAVVRQTAAGASLTDADGTVEQWASVQAAAISGRLRGRDVVER